MGAAAMLKNASVVDREPGSIDDVELARRAGSNDCDAWRELVRRFTPGIRWQLGRTLAARQRLLCSDSVDEALGEFWMALIKNDRAWLRRFDGRHSLANWLNVLAWDVATKHLRRLRRWRRGASVEQLDIDREPWSARGATFLALLERIQPAPPPKKRAFKWR
jgi:hypothetical protein